MGKFRKSLSLAFVVVFLVPLIVQLGNAETAPTWNIQTIDRTSGGAGSIAIDSNGNPHILYFHYEHIETRTSLQTKLLYLSKTNSTWAVMEIPQVSHFNNFVLDSENNIHILFGSTIASWNGTNWNMQAVTVDGSANVLALDSEDNPHVVYTATLNSSQYFAPHYNSVVKYSSWNGSGWNTQIVDSPISGHGITLLLDSQNYPKILYSNDTYKNNTSSSLNPVSHGDLDTVQIKYASWNGSAWNTQTLFSNVTGYSNMVLDSKGYAHFTYSQNDTIFYASYNGSLWNSEAIISNAELSLGNAGSLALGLYDYPQIAYASNNSLVYSRWIGDKWDNQIVGPNSMFLELGNIVVDKTDNPYITYMGWPPETPTYLIHYSMLATAIEPPIAKPTPTPISTLNSWSTVSQNLILIIGITIVITVALAVSLLFRKHRKTTAHS